MHLIRAPDPPPNHDYAHRACKSKLENMTKLFLHAEHAGYKLHETPEQAMLGNMMLLNGCNGADQRRENADQSRENQWPRAYFVRVVQ